MSNVLASLTFSWGWEPLIKRTKQTQVLGSWASSVLLGIHWFLYCLDSIMVHWLMCRCDFTCMLSILKLKGLPRMHLQLFVFLLNLLVSFYKCLYVHLYIQKNLTNRFKKWNIFSEIKELWCHKDFCLFLSPLVTFIFALTYFGLWNPADVIEILMDDTMCWQSYPSLVRWNLTSTLNIPTPRSFLTSPLLCPLHLSSLMTRLALA